MKSLQPLSYPVICKFLLLFSWNWLVNITLYLIMLSITFLGGYLNGSMPMVTKQRSCHSKSGFKGKTRWRMYRVRDRQQRSMSLEKGNSLQRETGRSKAPLYFLYGPGNVDFQFNNPWLITFLKAFSHIFVIFILKWHRQVVYCVQ